MARFRTLSARPNAMISAAQCRSARALLGWSVAKLASAASVSASAIDDFEAERRAPVPAVAGPIRRAFEPVGVVFLPSEDVRLRPGALFEVGGDSARVQALISRSLARSASSLEPCRSMSRYRPLSSTAASAMRRSIRRNNVPGL